MNITMPVKNLLVFLKNHISSFKPLVILNFGLLHVFFFKCKAMQLAILFLVFIFPCKTGTLKLSDPRPPETPFHILYEPGFMNII